MAAREDDSGDRRPRRDAGFTLVEVAVALAILAVVSIGLVAMLAEGHKLETLKREQRMVEDALLARVQELRTLTTASIREQNNTTFAIGALPAVTPPPNGSPSTVGVTFGGVSITTTGAALTVTEVDPSDSLTPRANSGYFSVVATATWTGIMGQQTSRIASNVISHAE